MGILALAVTAALGSPLPLDPPVVAPQDRIQALVAKLEAEDDAERTQAIEALAREGKRAGDPLEAMLRSNSSSMRGKTGVIEVWGRMKKPGVAMLEDILLRFHTTSIITSENALSAIGELGPRAAWTAPTLLEILGRKEDKTFSEAMQMQRCHAISVLGRLGLTTPPVRTALKKQFGDENPLVRTTAACALWWTGSEPDEVLPVLREGLKATGDQVLVERAIFGLGEMGPAAEPVLPELDALRDKVGKETKFTIEEAVKKIRGFQPPVVTRVQPGK